MKKICDGCHPSACSARRVCDGVRRPGRVSSASESRHPGLSVDGERRSAKRWNALASRIARAMRRIVRGDDENLVQLQRALRPLRPRGGGRSESGRTCRPERRGDAARSCLAADACARVVRLRSSQSSRLPSWSPASAGLRSGLRLDRGTLHAISFHAASSSASTPSPVAPEILRTAASVS